MPLMESRIRKYFPSEADLIFESVSGLPQPTQNALLKTIKISKNLFSLTERLPKPKYRSKINYSSLTNAKNTNGMIDNK
jgi:hypothetical protein